MNLSLISAGDPDPGFLPRRRRICYLFNGSGFRMDFRTKKLGKQNAAEAALKSIVQFRNPLEAQVRLMKALKL